MQDSPPSDVGDNDTIITQNMASYRSNLALSDSDDWTFCQWPGFFDPGIVRHATFSLLEAGFEGSVGCYLHKLMKDQVLDEEWCKDDDNHHIAYVFIDEVAMEWALGMMDEG